VKECAVLMFANFRHLRDVPHARPSRASATFVGFVPRAGRL
jgi:hypothetical protein